VPPRSKHIRLGDDTLGFLCLAQLSLAMDGLAQDVENASFKMWSVVSVSCLAFAIDFGAT